jgi:hypothetical protein
MYCTIRTIPTKIKDDVGMVVLALG